jgi:uncharacterized protein (TIGR02145 family)
MKTKNLVLAGFAIMLLSFFNTIHAQSGDNNTVKIGKQVWATVNLNVTTFANGDLIPEAESDSAWNKACKDGKPAWCYNKKDTVNGKICGRLYNWYAVNDPRGLAPKGWHIPTREEWFAMLYEKDATPRDANNFKSTTGWKKDPDGDGSNGNGNNSTGFSAYPDGYREYDAESFQRTGEYAFFWTASNYDDSSAWDLHFLNVGNISGSGNYAKGAGLSVRCIKD